MGALLHTMGHVGLLFKRRGEGDGAVWGGGGGVEMKEEKNKKKAEREHGARMHFG